MTEDAIRKALKELSDAVFEVGIALHTADEGKQLSALLEKWSRVIDAQAAAVDALRKG